MQKLLILLVVAACSCAFSELASFHKFQKFVKDNNKTYKTLDEYTKRYHIFLANLKKIEDRNRSWEGVTKFMDLTQTEFQRHYANLRFDASTFSNLNVKRVKPTNLRDDPPEQFDWRGLDAVRNIKDQQQCGSCWAFSACANLEGQYYLKYKEKETFSEQQLVSCDDLDDGKILLFNQF